MPDQVQSIGAYCSQELRQLRARCWWHRLPPTDRKMPAPRPQAPATGAAAAKPTQRRAAQPVHTDDDGAHRADSRRSDSMTARLVLEEAVATASPPTSI